MKRLKFKDEYYKIIDGFEVNESSREVKYSNVKIDFTNKSIADLPLKYQECKLLDVDIIEKEASEGTTEEGTSLSIDYDTDRNYEYSFKGQTSQSGTPTPSSPQPINITTGRQVVSVCGKNLFTGTLVQKGFNSNTGQLFDSNTRVSTETYLSLKAGTYKISVKNSTNRQLVYYVYDNAGTYLSGETYTGWLSIPTTISLANDRKLRFGFRKPNNDNITPSEVEEIQLEKGSQATTYEEYKGNDYEINLGKNLFYINDCTITNGGTVSVSNGNTITITGTFSAGTNISFDSYVDFSSANSQLGNAMTLSVQNIVNSGTASITPNRFFIASANTFPYLQPDQTTGYQTKTITEAFNRCRLYVPAGTYDTTINVQLEKGSFASSFSPYKTPIYLGEIGTYQDYINKSNGKNLLPNNIETQTVSGITFTKNNDGSITINGTHTGSDIAYIDIYNSPTERLIKDTTKTYTYSLGVTNSNIKLIFGEYIRNTIREITHDTPSMTFTPDESSSGQIFRIQIVRNATINNVVVYPQIEEGEETDYEPYGTGQWYIHKEIGKYTFTGSENWQYTSATKRFSNVFSNINLITPTDTGRHIEYIKSNYFYNSTSDVDGGMFQYQNQIIVHNYNYTSASDFKTWLSSHNVEVYYVLATPTTILIEDEELINQLNAIELLNGLNNINVSSPYLPIILRLHYNFNDYIIKYIENGIIYTGYVNNYTLPKMKNKLEYRELDIDLLSPLALATLRTVDVVGTYNLQPLVREIIQPLIDDGFKLKELNINNNQISVNYLTETIESALNKLSNNFNFWWYIDKNKNIFINDINYLFNKNRVFTYNDNNKINGLIDFTPSMESIDYCNTIDFTNVRLITKSHFQKDYMTSSDGNYYEYMYYNPLIIKDTIEPGEEIEFDIPFLINTDKRGISNTSPNVEQGFLKIYSSLIVDNVQTMVEIVSLRADNNNKVIIPSNVSISDSYNEDNEFVFVKDSFFDNLIIGMKYNGSSTINVGLIVSDTALMWAKVRVNDNKEIEINKDIISTTGIVEKQVDMNEQWKTYEELLVISNSLIKNNNVNVEKVILETDKENNFNIGDIISINKTSFLTYGDFIITDKRRSYYDNVDRWTFSLNNTNILESYVDLFRAREEEQQTDKIYNLITGDYSKEGIKESYEVDVL